MADPSTSVMSLEQQLRAAIQNQASPSGKGFVPLDRLDAIVTKESVQDALRGVPGLLGVFAESGDALVTSILGPNDQGPDSDRKIKLFAILALIGSVEKITDFINHGVSDSSLPFSIDLVPGNPGLSVVAGDNVTSLSTCFEGWEPSAIQAFEEQQWAVLAPVFRKEGPFLNLSSKAILPFIDEATLEMQQRVGGYSKIIPVKIHPSHVDPDSSAGMHVFAVKRYHPTQKESFRRELAALQRFSNGVPHPNILEFVSAWHQNGEFNLIFPWALSDLSEWWRNNPFPLGGPNAKTITILADQLLGIASGLSAIHKFLGPSDPSQPDRGGRHGDIKPQNILLFPDPNDPTGPGTWKISDFGTSGVASTPLSTPNGNRLGCTPAYRAPEYDFHDRDIGKAYDVWSLACVLLECLTWFLSGVKGIQELEAYRFRGPRDGPAEDGAFWEMKPATDPASSRKSIAQAMVKDCVSQWMTKLGEKGRDQPTPINNFIVELLSMIEKEMLVVDDDKRNSSSEIADKLKQMRESLPQSVVDVEQAMPPSVGGSMQDKRLCLDFACTPADAFVQGPGMPDFLGLLPADDLSVVSSSDATSQQIDMSYHTAPGDLEFFPVPSPDLSSNGTSQIDTFQFQPAQYFTEPPVNAPVEKTQGYEQQGRKRRHENFEGEKESPKARRLDSASQFNPPRPPTTTNKIKGRGRAKDVADTPASQSSQGSQGSQRFACPFHKYDPKTFGIHDPRWRTCVGPGWTTIHRVKEHIDRKHSVQPNTCSRCLASFRDPHQLSQHQKSKTPCQANAECLLRVTEAQRSLMRKRPRGRTEVDAWNDIYRIIFGLRETDPVPGPYCETATPNESDSPQSTTTQQPQSSLDQFEEYLRQNILPSADVETLSKIQGYFDLARKFRESDDVGPCSAPQTTQATAMSSVPSLLEDEPTQMTWGESSYDTQCEGLTVEPLQIFNPTLSAAPPQPSKKNMGHEALNTWDQYLTREEEELSHILFSGLDSQGSC